MKVKFEINTETEDQAKQKILRLAKADDMAMFIWELVHNGWREWKHDDSYDHQPAWDKIHELLDEFGINPDELIN